MYIFISLIQSHEPQTKHFSQKQITLSAAVPNIILLGDIIAVLGYVSALCDIPTTTETLDSEIFRNYSSIKQHMIATRVQKGKWEVEYKVLKIYFEEIMIFMLF